MATENDSVSSDAIGTLAIVLAAAVVAVGLAVTALVRTEQSDLSLSREAQANLRPIRELRASQLGELNAAPTWVNREKGTVSIPIERAMELVVDQARSKSQPPPVAAPTTPAPGASVLARGTEPAESGTAPNSPPSPPPKPFVQATPDPRASARGATTEANVGAGRAATLPPSPSPEPSAQIVR